MNRKRFIPSTYKRILLVGVGGTGSYLAQGLAKMIAGYKLDISVLMVDPDFIEPKNCARQNFMPYEVNQPKAEALATRLNQQYLTDFMFASARGEDVVNQFKCRDRLIISCVDSISARRELVAHGHWLDLGNNETTGQAIYGTTNDEGVLEAQTYNWDKYPTVGALPCPATVVGMSQLKDTKAVPNCADHPFNEQGVFVNELAALAGLSILHQLLVVGTLKTPHIYFDTSTGRMNPVFITKEIFDG